MARDEVSDFATVTVVVPLRGRSIGEFRDAVETQLVRLGDDLVFGDAQFLAVDQGVTDVAMALGADSDCFDAGEK